mgnify:CR=1 FL=1
MSRQQVTTFSAADFGVAGASIGIDPVAAFFAENQEREKSAFFRSWERKEQREAYLQVLKRGPNGTMEPVESDPERRFIITGSQMPRREKISVLKTFGDDADFLSTFGEDTLMWSFSGVLRNERRLREKKKRSDGDWMTALTNKYTNEFRASVLARTQRMLRFVIGDMFIEGYMVSFGLSQTSDADDAMANFSFEMVVRDYYTSYDIEGEGAIEEEISETPEEELDLPPAGSGGPTFA